MYIFLNNLAKYLYYRRQSYDSSRKWSWKKENAMFYVMVLKERDFICNLKMYF